MLELNEDELDRVDAGRDVATDTKLDGRLCRRAERAIGGGWTERVDEAGAAGVRERERERERDLDLERERDPLRRV